MKGSLRAASGISLKASVAIPKSLLSRAHNIIFLPGCEPKHNLAAVELNRAYRDILAMFSSPVLSKIEC